MGENSVYCLICALFGLVFFRSGSGASKIHSNTQKEVTNPITTVPLVNYTAPIAETPFTTTTSSAPTASTMTPSATAASSSWCVASQSASLLALQAALDYACGRDSADCSAIQPSGWCYEPNTIRDHAGYAFNSFYQRNPVLTSCNFGGSAVITNTDPSNGKCRYPSVSTSTSILNTTNDSGSIVFGAQPSGPSVSAAAICRGSESSFILILFPMLWLKGRETWS